MSEYTNCPDCKDIVYGEERGHIVTFDKDFILHTLGSLLHAKDNVHIAIDISDPADPWELPCCHITWVTNSRKTNLEIEEDDEID